MGFDKSKVYTALNADELKLGSKCVFADTINDLRKYTQDKDVDTYVQRLKCLYGDEYSARFILMLTLSMNRSTNRLKVLIKRWKHFGHMERGLNTRLSFLGCS